MKMNLLRPFKNIRVVDDAQTIRALSADKNIDRRFTLAGPLNRYVIKRVLKNLSYNGCRFPHMLPEPDVVRVARHTQLWESFNANAGAMALAPAELEPLAKWIRRESSGDEPGILTQQIIGKFFNPAFRATAATWQAALILHEDAVSTNLAKMIWWQLTAKATRAKKILAASVNEDIVAMHGIGIAIHNLVASMHTLQSRYADATKRAHITPAMAVDLCLSAPPVVLRQSLEKGAANGCPYSKFTLFMLKLKEANKDNKAKDLIFMTGTWSRCPAEQWIPAVIAGIWKRVMLPAPLQS